MTADKKIAVIGLGVIGLPTAFMFADVGYKVYGIDKDADRVTALNNGTFNLPDDLRELKGNPTFYGDIQDAMDYIIVCVGVGIDEAHKPVFKDFDCLLKQIGHKIKSGMTICFETTLPPGTMYYKVRPILEAASGLICGRDFYLVYAPERVTLERLVYNMRNMPRIIGGYSNQCRIRGGNLYLHICKYVNTTDLKTAEITKLTENTYRDVNIAYANEIAAICDACDVNFLEVRRLVNTLPDIPPDEYINPVRNLHFAGVGVGGYCLPKDPHLLRTVRPLNLENSIIKTARDLNDEIPKYIASKASKIIIESRRAQDGRGYNVLILGAASIRNTGDCRNSPIESLIVGLAGTGFINEIKIYDPFVPEYSGSCIEFIKTATLIVLATPHKIFDDIFDEDVMYQLKVERVILNTYANILKS